MVRSHCSCCSYCCTIIVRRYLPSICFANVRESRNPLGINSRRVHCSGACVSLFKTFPSVTRLIVKTYANSTYEVWPCNQGSESIFSQQNHITSSFGEFCTTVAMPVGCYFLECIHDDDVVVSPYLPTTTLSNKRM